MRYGDCRWTDIDAADGQRVVALCPLAALEQHGHHLPLLTDTYLVTAVAERVHERLGDRVLLVPTLWLGASAHHLPFPGTLSLPTGLYSEVIQQLAASLLGAGMRRIFFLNGHGGNVAPGEAAITEIANTSAVADEALIALSSYWTIAGEAIAAERHGMETPALEHACEYETSMMCYLHGELVRMDRARGSVDPMQAVRGVRIAGRFSRRSETGALGRPELATSAKGESLLAAIVESVADAVTKFAELPLPAVRGPQRP